MKIPATDLQFLKQRTPVFQAASDDMHDAILLLQLTVHTHD
jgi:hypothetical protein